MLIRNVKLNQPVKVKVGDIEFVVFRIGDKSARLGIDAPEGIKIEIEQEDIQATKPRTDR